jgi:hypothetical protein
MPKPPEPAPKPVETPKPEPKPPPPLPKPSETQKPPETDSKHADSAKPEPKTSKPAPKPVETQPPQQASARQPAVEPSKETSESAATPGATRDVLSLSPMPAAPGQAGAIPTGEARGRFVISPQANLSGSDTEPGFKTGTPSPEIGIGNTTSGAPARKGVAPKTAPTASPGKGPNTGSAAAKSGADGSDAGTNAGRNSGSGTGSGSGNGSSSGSGKKPFAGITIVGGEYEPGTDRDSPPVVPAVRPLQTAYSLSIISTEDSGGGLPFYGVFSHEQIYTVYLDMRTVETDQDPSWTLEFAVSQNPPAPAAVQNISRNQQGFVLPFPSTKEKPAWPAGLARRYLGKMMVVYGLVNTGGKMEQISIKETPDAQLNEPVVRALSKWVFRPATLEGQPVSAKALMGIPIWSPE